MSKHHRTLHARRTWTFVVLVLVGVALCAIQVVRLSVWDDHAANSRQRNDAQTLRHTWNQEPTPAKVAREPATPSASRTPPVKNKPTGGLLLSIPSWNKEWALQTYRSPKDLDRGPSWFPFTQDPGTVGNMVVIGHRNSHGGPFGRLPELARGNRIQVETARMVYTYKVTKTAYRVRDTDLDVLNPVPRSSKAPTVATLTVISCELPYSPTHRLVMHAVLEKRINK